MRSLYLFAFAALVSAQSSTTTYQRDINGNRLPVASQDQSPTGERTQRMQSVNGRQIPIEQVTERLVRDDGRGGKVVERSIQKFDANGRPSGIEKITIEETPLPGGGKLSKETRAEADMNGRFSPVERKTTETRVAGQTTSTSVTLERPTPSNAFQAAEKRSTVTVGSEGKQQSTETVERLDVAGRFRPVTRTESSTQAASDKTTQNTATYELDGVGKLTLAKQTVATTTKRNGVDVTETNVFATATLGRTASATDRLQLQQQQTTERKIGPDGSVTEIVSVRTPNPSDPTRLGDAKKVSETICTGKCLPAAPAAQPAPAPAKAATAAKK